VLLSVGEGVGDGDGEAGVGDDEAGDGLGLADGLAGAELWAGLAGALDVLWGGPTRAGGCTGW